MMEFSCPVEATVHLIGGKYKSVILWHLKDQTLRYSALHRLVPRATPKMLTEQLRALEADGLIAPPFTRPCRRKRSTASQSLGARLFPCSTRCARGAARISAARSRAAEKQGPRPRGKRPTGVQRV